MKKENLTGLGPTLLVVIVVGGVIFLCNYKNKEKSEIAKIEKTFIDRQQSLKGRIDSLSKRCGGICDTHEQGQKQPDTITFILKEMRVDERQLNEQSNAVSKATQDNQSSFSAAQSVVDRSETHLKAYDNWRHPQTLKPDKPNKVTTSPKPCDIIKDSEDLSVSSPKIIRKKITFDVITIITDCRKIKSSSLHFSIENNEGKEIIGINPGNETKLDKGKGGIAFEDAKISENLSGFTIVLKRIKKNNTIEELYRRIQ